LYFVRIFEDVAYLMLQRFSKTTKSHSVLVGSKGLRPLFITLRIIVFLGLIDLLVFLKVEQNVPQIKGKHSVGSLRNI
jgi:hypothetical protein